MMNDNEHMMKQKTMLPAVSMRAFPEGNFRGSTRFTARWDRINVMFDNGSKMASAMVVNNDNEPEEAAAYSCNPANTTFAAKLPWMAI